MLVHIAIPLFLSIIFYPWITIERLFYVLMNHLSAPLPESLKPRILDNAFLMKALNFLENSQKIWFYY